MEKATSSKRPDKLTIALLVVVTVMGFYVYAQSNRESGFPPPEPRPTTPPLGTMRAFDPMAALTTSQNFSAARVSSFQRDGGNADNFWIPTDGTETTLAEIEGPGAITHIWTTHRTGGHDLIIRIYWEGSEHPSVEAPLGDFFGVSMGVNATMSSFPIQTSSDGRSRSCWWNMPFNRSAKITVTAPPSEENAKSETVPLYFYIDYRVYSKPIEDIHYFHARFRETDVAQRGELVLLAEIEGDGHYVGLVLGNRVRTPAWFGEGDDLITVDGQMSFVGTGTEDYFCDAWGFHKYREFSDLYYGAPYLDERDIGAKSCAYRFHIIDPIPFRQSFKFEIEHWPWLSPLRNSGRDYFSSTSFWYQKTVHKAWPRLEKILASEPWDPAKGRWYVPGAVEAETLKVLDHESQADGNPAPEVKHVMPNLSGDHMLVFDSGGKGSFSVAVPAEQSGTYTVGVYCPRASDRGIVQLHVNGHTVGEPMDFYRRTKMNRPPVEHSFPNVPLEKGDNTFEFFIDSKNAESDGYKIGVDYLMLRKERD